MHEKQLIALQKSLHGFVSKVVERHPTWHDLDSLFPLPYYDELQFKALFAKWRCRRDFESISSTALRRRLEKAVICAIDAPDESAKIAEELAANLMAPMKCDVVLPLSGVDLQFVSFMLAEDIIAVFLTDEEYDKIVVRPHERAAIARADDPAAARQRADLIRRRIGDRSVFRVQAPGDEFTAMWAAQKRADLAVDALQFIAAISEAEHWHYYVDWRGTSPAMSWQATAVIPLDGHALPINPAQRTGALTLWRPRPDALAHLQVSGGMTLALLPLKREPTLHESRLARAIRAVAAGERAPTTDSRKLNYVSAFDIFFSIPNTNEVTRNIREGVAFAFFGTDEQRDDERFELAEFLNRVYQSRSETSHEFQVGIFEPDDLKRLREIAITFVGIMFESFRFDDEAKRDVDEWLNACRNSLGAERYERYNGLSRRRIDISKTAR